LLGSTDGVVVLSEVAPSASARDVLDQAVHWLGLVADDEVDRLRALAFGPLIADLAARARRRGSRLVVRDFVTPSFLPRSFAQAIPSGGLDAVDAMRAAGMDLRQAVVVRRSASVYASIVGAFPHLADLTVDDFAVAYHSYASAVAPLPRIHLEDLVADPAGVLSRLCSLLDCPYAEAALTTFASFTACTGDLDVVAESRGTDLDRVTVRPDHAGDPAFGAADRHPLCQAADRMLGYDVLLDSSRSLDAFDAYAAMLAATRRQLSEAVSARRRADAAARSAHDEAERIRLEAERRVANAAEAARAAEHERLTAEIQSAKGDAARARDGWDRATGELARAEGVAAERLRTIERLLSEAEKQTGTGR
jgi:hypothetical protein